MFGRGEYKLEDSAEVKVPPPAPLTAGALNRAARVTSLDAYRGLIMILLAGGAFGLREVARQQGDDPAWQDVLFHVTHPGWLSQFSWIGVSAWDLIQPAFMFMVGVALPFSVARRKILGQSTEDKSCFEGVFRNIMLSCSAFQRAVWPKYIVGCCCCC